VSPVALSLAIAALSTLAITLVAVPLAFALAHARFRGKLAIETMLTLPLVLPPTVVGYLIIVSLGSQGWVGSWLHDAFGYSILFRIEGAVLAAGIVAFPLLYLPAKAAFAGVEHEFEEIAAIMGASRWQTFWHVSLPMARRGILSGQVLAFARALGEFGATVMVFGWQPGRTTMPISVWSAYEQGQMARAWPTVLGLTAICFGLLLLFNRVGGRAQR
jgi:molybdate transport system permease protein